MENEEEVIVTEQENDTEVEVTEEKSTREIELEAELAKYKRMSEQRAKKLEKVTETKSEKSLDYGAKAYLVANGIKGTDEFAIIEEVMGISGKTLEDVIENPYVKSQLQSLREQKATQEAMPSKSNRSGVSAKTEVEYWIAKGELPPIDNPSLRREVVNRKLAIAKNKSKFAN